MSNEERTNRPDEPDVTESQTLDDAPSAAGSVEERLSNQLNEAAEGMTASLNDLQRELTPTTDPLPHEEPAPAPEQEALPGYSPATEPQPAGQETALLAPPIAAGGSGVPPSRSYTPEGSDDDRLLSGLAWLSLVILQLPVVSVIQLLSPSNRERAFQRHHAVNSLLFFVAAIVYEIVAAIAFTLLTIVTAGCGALCLWVIFFVPHALGLYYAYQAYMGKRIEVPVLSEFGRKQGWM